MSHYTRDALAVLDEARAVIDTIYLHPIALHATRNEMLLRIPDLHADLARIRRSIRSLDRARAKLEKTCVWRDEIVIYGAPPGMIEFAGSSFACYHDIAGWTGMELHILLFNSHLLDAPNERRAIGKFLRDHFEHSYLRSACSPADAHVTTRMLHQAIKKEHDRTATALDKPRYRGGGKLKKLPFFLQKKAGRPRDSDPASDKAITDAWTTGHFPTYADLARELGQDTDEVARAIDRHRKRRNN